MEDKTDLVLAILTGVTMGLCCVACLRGAWDASRRVDQPSNAPKIHGSSSSDNLTSLTDEPTNSV